MSYVILGVLLLSLLFPCTGIAHFYFIIVLIFFLLKSSGFYNLLLKQ